MNIAIVTIQDINNYGNRLQNYATQRILEKKKHNVVSLMNTNLKGMEKKINFMYMSGLYHSLIYAKYLKKDKRLFNFILFDKKYIKLSNKLYKKEANNSKLNKKFDFFIVGSDQVWNPKFNLAKRLDLLEDIDYNKSISLSASIGISELNDGDKKKFARALPNIKHISVREDRARELLQPYASTKIEVLVDPTMMLSADEWQELEIKPYFLKNKNYILIYCLGALSSERKKFIDRIAKENSYDIIELMDSDSIAYTSGPSEFLYLIHHAKLVCTDSFHACVFSIIFDTQFYIFDREDGLESMNSRIDTLLKKFQLEQHRKKDYDNYSIIHDYTNAYKILNNEKRKFNNFLDTCFSEGKNEK